MTVPSSGVRWSILLVSCLGLAGTASAESAGAKRPGGYVLKSTALKGGPPGARLSRGERVVVLQRRADRAKVRTPAGIQGWVPESRILVGASLRRATVAEPVRLFARPAPDAATARAVPPGEILFFLDAREGFALVQRPSGLGWVRIANLVEKPEEVEAAVALSRLHDLEAAGAPNAEAARQAFTERHGASGVARAVAAWRRRTSPAMRRA